MASADRATECSICFEIFVNPKLLPCRHSYCEKCMQGLTRNTKVQCPICKQFCDVDRIVHDFQTENFVQAFQELEEEFNQRLIAATATSNPHASAPPEHIVTSTDKCKLCDENEISCWCVECKQWICLSCKNIHLKGTHTKDHNIEKLSSKNKEVESSLEAEIRCLKIKMDEFHQCIKTLKTEQKNIQGIKQKTLQQSKELRAQVILEVHSKFNRIDNDIITRTDEYASLLDCNLSNNQKKVFDLETKYQAFLTTIKNKNQNLAIDGVNELQRAKELVRNTASPDMCITSITIKLQRLQEWNAEAVSLDINGGRITQKSQPNLTDRSIELVSSTQWKKLLSVDVQAYPYCLRNVGNKLYQCNDNGITVYNAKLKQVNSIYRRDMGSVYDVCDMPNGDLVVATILGLYHTKPQGRQLQQILKGHVTCVVRHRKRYYAAHYDTATIHVYKHAGEWKQCHSFRVDAANPYTITLCISKDLLYACFVGEDRIDILSLDGQVKSRTGCKGTGAAGQISCPYICATDAAGAVLIADQSNNRLQRLSTNGQWSIVQLEPPVKMPWGACIMNDTLYVNEYGKRLIHAYKMD